MNDSDLLLPQRKLVKGNNRALENEVHVYPLRPPPKTVTTIGNMSNTNHTQTSKRELISLGNNNSNSKKGIKQSIIETIILSDKSIIHEFLPTRSFFNLCGTNRIINSYYKRLLFVHYISFHDFASLVRYNKGFGILIGCNLHVGYGMKLL